MAFLVPIFYLMAAKNPRGLNRLEIGFSDEVYGRLEKYCSYAVVDRATFVKIAAIERLDQLDEREAYLAAQLAIAKGAAAAARVPTTSARGMEIEIPAPKAPVAPVEKVPRNLEKSFRKYLDYIGGSDSAIDRSIRLQTCLDDMKERAKTPEAAHAAFVELQKLIARREDAGIGVSPLKLPDEIKLEGDVD